MLRRSCTWGVMLIAVGLGGCFEDASPVNDSGEDTSGTTTTSSTAADETTISSSTAGTVTTAMPVTTMVPTDTDPGCDNRIINPATLPADVVIAIDPDVADTPAVVNMQLDEAVVGWESAQNQVALLGPNALTFPGSPPCLNTQGCVLNCPLPPEALFALRSNAVIPPEALLPPTEDFECVFRLPADGDPPVATRHVILATTAGGAPDVALAGDVQVLFDAYEPYFWLTCPGCESPPSGTGNLEQRADSVIDLDDFGAIHDLVSRAGQPRYVCKWPVDPPPGHTPDEVRVRIDTPGLGGLTELLPVEPGGCSADDDILEWHFAADGDVVLCPRTCRAMQKHPAGDVVIEHLWGPC